MTIVNPITPLEAFYKRVESTPNKVYLRQPRGARWQEFTWVETQDIVRKLAQKLKDLGINPGDRVAILAKNSAFWFMSDLAIMMVGAVSVPLYPTQTDESMTYVLNHSEAKAIFLGKLDRPMASGVMSDEIIKINMPGSKYESADQQWDEIVWETAPIDTLPKWPEQQLATIVYTSGTTGNPKGVMHTFESLAFAAANFSDHLNFNPNDRYLSYLPLSHIAERALVEMSSFYSGGTVSFVESMDSFSDNLTSVSPTVFFSVPRLWQKFHDAVCEKMPPKKLDRLLKIPILSGIVAKKIRVKLGLNDAKAIGSGAAAIAPDLLNWYKRIGINITEGYGQTEAVGYSTVNTNDAIKIGTVGQALPGVELKLSEEGELLTRSKANMLGYYNAPKATAETFEDGFIKTGDLAQIDNQGFVSITGRLKDTFKTDKGKFVAPVPIENRIISHPAIEQLCLVGSGVPQPVALVVPTEAARKLPKKVLEKDLTTIKDMVNLKLQNHEQIDKIIVVKDEWTQEKGFLTPTLKLRRHLVEKHYSPVAQTTKTVSETVLWET